MNEEEILKSELENLTLKNVETFSLNGLNTYCKILRIHDPDTFTIAFKLGDEYYKYNTRLNGIDAPELHSKVEKEALVCQLGIKYISDLILDKIIFIKCYSFDKYGRLLADLYINKDDTQSINELLISRKYVRAYGKDDDLHKGPWTDDELNVAITNAIDDNLITEEEINLIPNSEIMDQPIESKKIQSKKYRKVKIDL